MSPKPTIDRLPPHSPDHEQAVLGCILLNPNECMADCLTKLKGTEVFYDLRHQTIYDVMAELFDKREPVDVISVQQRLKDRKMLEEVGGITYLAGLGDMVPSASNLGYYLETVIHKWRLRKIIKAATEIVSTAYESEGDPEEIIDRCEKLVMDAIPERGGTSKTMKSLVTETLNTLESYHQNQGKPTGIPTGFSDYDQHTGGMQEGELILIAARPSVGKTALAMNIVEHVAVDLKIPVGVFSLEMTAESLVMRMVCSRARVNGKSIRQGLMTQGDFPKIAGSAGKLAYAPIWIDDEAGLSILRLRAKARRMVQQYGIKLFVVDYIQLANAAIRKGGTKAEEVGAISGGLKHLAKELRVPVLALSQLNREIDRDKNRTPRLSDLRDSGSLEQDADVVGFLYRHGNEDDDVDCISVKWPIAKGRNYGLTEISLMFHRSTTRFNQAAKGDFPV